MGRSTPPIRAVSRKNSEGFIEMRPEGAENEIPKVSRGGEWGGIPFDSQLQD